MKSKIDSWRKIMNIKSQQIKESKCMALSNSAFFYYERLDGEEKGIRTAMEWADEIFGKAE